MRISKLVFVFFFLSSLAYAGDLPKKELKVFTAKVSDVRLQGTLQDQGKKLDDVVSVEIPAIIFKKPIEIADVRKAQIFQVPEIDILISYLKANINGSSEDMAAFWAPNEQKELLSDMSNPEMFRKNRSYRQAYPGLTILGMIFQDKTITVIIREMNPNPIFPALGVTFVRIAGKLYLTNYPDNDLELAIVEASFK